MEKKDSQRSFMSSQGCHGWHDGGPFDVTKLLNGEETRTNLMVKNVPCRYTQQEIRADFDRNHKNRFNDLKVPMDKQSSDKTGKGYCFINFRHVLYVYDFFHDKRSYHWPKYASDKIIEINYANQQPVISPAEAMAGQLNGTSESKLTEQERAELQKILDDYKINIPLEKFPPIQPARRPSYNHKGLTGPQKQFADGEGGHMAGANQSRGSHKNSYTNLFQQQHQVNVNQHSMLQNNLAV